MKKFSKIKKFPLYHRSSVAPIYNYVIQNGLRRNTFSLRKVFLNYYFCLQHQFCVPHWWMMPNESLLFEGNKSQWKKKFLQSINFFSMVGPLYSHWQQCPLKKPSHQRIFPKKLFSKYNFQVLWSFLCPIDSLLQTFQKFFREKSFLWKDSSAKKKFSFLSSELCTPTYNIVKFFLKKNTYQKKLIFPNYVFFIFIRKYPHWWNLQNNTNLFSDSNFQKKKHFL